MNTKELTFRALLIGALGSVVITASSLYVALRLGALPWPTIFVAILSMALLKAFGKTNLREINVAHTAMSAGAMVAGGMAFTFPAIWILNPDAKREFVPILLFTLVGTVLGLIATALFRRYFIETESERYPYPIGTAAYETLKAGDKGGRHAVLLFSSLGAAALFTLFRDLWGKIPQVLTAKKLAAKNISLGLWLSPMALGVGYIIGPLYSGVWGLGAIIGFFIIVPVGIGAGWFTGPEAADLFRRSLGIGLMVGTGVGLLLRGILPRIKKLITAAFASNTSKRWMRWLPLIVAVIVAAVLPVFTEMSLPITLIVIFGSWLAAMMAASLTGQTGINPMEILGILVLLAVKALLPASTTILVSAAAVTAVSAGLAGDMMNDYKAGALLGTKPRSQRSAETLGAIIGAVVSVLVFFLLIGSYGVESLGKQFPAPQAQAVAAMAGGDLHRWAFFIGLFLGAVFFILKIPAMTLGLGVYLPTFITTAIFIGGMIRLGERLLRKGAGGKGGTVIASGLLGGEAVTGVVLALFRLFSMG